MKNRPLHIRARHALAGIRTVYRRERSFRTQVGVAVVVATAAVAWRVGPVPGAVLALAIALVLVAEAINAAIEYLLDHLHPELADEVGVAKDAAAGAVLLASTGAAIGGALIVLAARR